MTNKMIKILVAVDKSNVLEIITARLHLLIKNYMVLSEEEKEAIKDSIKNSEEISNELKQVVLESLNSDEIRSNKLLTETVEKIKLNKKLFKRSKSNEFGK